jgi:hypothetical protein
MCRGGRALGRGRPHGRPLSENADKKGICASGRHEAGFKVRAQGPGPKVPVAIPCSFFLSFFLSAGLGKRKGRSQKELERDAEYVGNKLKWPLTHWQPESGPGTACKPDSPQTNFQSVDPHPTRWSTSAAQYGTALEECSRSPQQPRTHHLDRNSRHT